MEQNASPAVTIDDFLASMSASAGDDLLIQGPAMSGKHVLAYRALATAATDSLPVCVTTTDTANRVRDTFESAGGDSERLLVVDAVSRQSGVGTREDARTRYASSPADLTGVGMTLSGLLEGTTEPPVVLVDSVSSLLLYSDLDTVFRFLHLLTGRIEAADGRTIQLLNTDSHTSQECAAITQLFELVVDLRRDDDDRSVRLRDGGGTQSEWQRLVFDDEVNR